jgi:nucleoside-diphosphate-sugar epimerase
MKILLTGASGFLGKNIINANTNNEFPYDIYSIGRTKMEVTKKHISWDAYSSPDLLDLPYEKIIHAAGKAHSIPRSKNEELEFQEVNHAGTLRLIEALNQLSKPPKQFIFISTIAVYGLDEGVLITEKTPLNAQTPYGVSKIKAEQALIKWSKESGVNLLILRLPLIAGNNPPGNLGKMKIAINKGHYIKIANNNARKSIVLASDVAKLVLGNTTLKGIYNLTDGVNPFFYQVEKAIEKRVKQKIKLSLNVFILKWIAKIGDILSFIGINIPINSLSLTKITSTLTFDDKKALRDLNWKPNPVIPFLEKNI